MPNHVTNILHSNNPAVVAALLGESEKYDEPTVDFSLVIPEPANIEKGGCNFHHEPGEVCWYQWNTANWGTKWNAYSTTVANGTVRFDTAWSHPFPVVEALSKRFPEAEITAQFADEDLGQNIGDYTILDGRVIEDRTVQEGTDEALAFAADLKYGMTYAQLKEEWDDD